MIWSAKSYRSCLLFPCILLNKSFLPPRHSNMLSYFFFNRLLILCGGRSGGGGRGGGGGDGMVVGMYVCASACTYALLVSGIRFSFYSENSSSHFQIWECHFTLWTWCTPFIYIFPFIFLKDDLEFSVKRFYLYIRKKYF